MVLQPLDPLHIHLLGGFRLSFGERSIPPEQFRLRKSRNLIKLLALAPQHRLHRDQLIEWLWPDSDPETAAHSLHQNVYAARRVLAAYDLPAQEVLQFTDEFLSLCPEMPLWIDAEAFEAAAKRTSSAQDPLHFQEALNLYPGDLLPEDRYEDWAASRRETLRQERLRLLLMLAALDYKKKDHPAAITAFQQALTADPACEEAHAGLMHLYTLSGQRSAALAQYETCRLALEKDLGVTPGPTTTALYEQISAGELAAQPLPTIPSTPTPSHPSNVPTFLIPFVGRQDLLASIRESLSDPACRLLTLVGPGGCGKTRLAVEAVSSLSTDFPDGIFFIRLVGLQSPSAIVPAIAQALGFVFYEGTHDPRHQLAGFLKSKKLLLLLDNFEQFLAAPALQGEEGAEVVTHILETAPGVKILVTSRARLDLLCETLLPIQGMRIPTEKPNGLEDALQYSAVRLFLEGSRRVAPDFNPAEADVGKILDICHLLQGMPLSILIAAGWMDFLSLSEIANQITEHCFDFLSSKSRDLPERQRSLRAIFEQSWHMLNEQERQIFAAMSVFRGGSTAEAAEQICGAPLVKLARLFELSFLERTPTGRFEVHELLRQFGEEKLSETSAMKLEIHNRHSRYYCELLARREYRLVVKNEREVIEEISREIDNLRQAWDWAVEYGLVELIDLCQVTFDHFLIFQGLFLEGKDRFARAAQFLRVLLAAKYSSLDEHALRVVIAHLDQHQARFCEYLRQRDQSVELYRSSLAVCQELGDRRGEAQSWREIAIFFLLQDEDEEGLLKAIRIYEELDDPFNQARVQVALASNMIETAKSFPQAERYLLDALATFRELGSPLNTANALFELGRLNFALGMFPQAEKYLRESLTIYSNSGRKYFIGRGLQELGRLFQFQEEREKAKQIYWECYQIYEELGCIPQQVYLLLSLQYMAVGQGDVPAVARLGELSYPLIQKVDPPLLMAFQGHYYAHQAFVTFSNGDYRSARRDFSRALELIRKIGFKLWYSQVFLYIGRYLAAVGQKERAIEMTVLAWNGLVIWPVIIEKLEKVAAAHAAGLPPETAAAARERGLARDFTTTADELIAAWKEGD